VKGSLEQLKEANYINLSLSHLSKCIMDLSDGHKFVSFRGSKLTHFLKDTLSGNSNTVLICTGSHQRVNKVHTKMTLEFGLRAQKVKTKPVSIEEMSKSKMLKEIKLLKQENLELRMVIEEFKNGGDLRLLQTVLTPEEEDKLQTEEEEEQEQTGEDTQPETSIIEEDSEWDTSFFTPSKKTEQISFLIPEKLQEEYDSLKKQNEKLREKMDELTGKQLLDYYRTTSKQD
jgi:DNA polymerase III gamma/tau subunit